MAQVPQLTRDKVSKLVGGDPELIRAYEALQKAMQFLPDEVEQNTGDLALAVGAAAGDAHQSLALLMALRDLLQPLAVAPVFEQAIAAQDPQSATAEMASLREEVAALRKRVEALEIEP